MDTKINKRSSCSVVAPSPEMVADYSCQIGENPAWHPMEKKIYWCDIATGRLFRYAPSSGTHEKCYEGGLAIGGFTIQSDGSLLLFMERGAIKKWQDGRITTIVEEIAEERTTRFNDVIADPLGRVFCGTMPTSSRLGRLYRLDCDGTLNIILEGIGCSNGMAFSSDRKHMYYTDSLARTIYIFEYEESTGSLRNQRTFVKTLDTEGVPDGATIDVHGYLWSAQWDGSCLIRYRSNGMEERRIIFPVKKVSSLTFGGKDYTDLYVTSAGGDNRITEGQQAGGLFRLDVGIKGVPDFFSRIAERT